MGAAAPCRCAAGGILGFDTGRCRRAEARQRDDLAAAAVLADVPVALDQGGDVSFGLPITTMLTWA